MKVVYVLLSAIKGLHRLVHTILPQVQQESHGLTIVGLCFFDDNALILNQDNPYGIMLNNLAEKENILLMIAQKSDLLSKPHPDKTNECKFGPSTKLKPSECTVITVKNGEHVGCYPDLFAALGDNRPDRIISI